MQKRVFIYQAVDKPFEVCLLCYWEFEGYPQVQIISDDRCVRNGLKSEVSDFDVSKSNQRNF